MRWLGFVAHFVFAALFVGSGALRAQDDANEFAVLLQDAQKNFDKGELRSAENAFQEILEAAEEEREEDRPSPSVLLTARCGLLQIELRRGNYREVARGIGELGEPQRSGREPQEALARALAAQGDYDGALAIWSAMEPVAYKPLTLPMKREGEISVGDVS